MQKTRKLLAACLNLFDGAGAGAGAGAAAAGDSNATGGSGEAQVLYGKQAAATDQNATASGSDAGSGNQEGTVTSNTLEDKRREFYKLVNGEYKDIYAEDSQRMINKKVREIKTLQETLAAQQPVVDMLMQRYNVTDGDLAKLTKALDEDNAYWEQAAEAAGMTVETYKNFQRVQRQNEQLQRAERQRQGEARAQQQMAVWEQQAQKVKQVYPDFDLQAEMQNKAFVAMLRNGFPMQNAYESANVQKLLADARQTAAQETEKRVVDNVRAKGARPQENGTSSQSASFIVKDDVSKLTSKDRAEIIKRVKRGEKIRF